MKETNQSVIQPAAAVVARADTSIEACVQLMRSRGVGSILIVSDTTQQQLVGIFTERDLLRNIELIESKEFWKKPVRTVMTHPVKVLMTSQLSQAGEIMLKHGFRHLPLVVEDEKVKYRLVGVISMRDLFQSYVRNETKSASAAPKETGRAPSKKKSTLGAVSTDPYFLQFLNESLAEPLSSEIKHVSFKDVHENLSKLRAVVLDLDHLKMTDWISLLKTINRKGRAPLTVVAFNPALFDAATVRTLEKLGHAPNIAVFAKPLAVSALLEKLAKARK